MRRPTPVQDRPARSTGMSNHVRVPAGVREGGQFRAHARSEGSGLGALVCVECGGNLVVESDGVPAHVGLDGEPFTTDHDYRDRDDLPDYGGATAFPDFDVADTPTPVIDDVERDPEPLDYEFQLSAAGLDYVTDNGDVAVQVDRGEDGRPVRLRRGKVVFEVPVIGTEQGHYGPVPIGSRRGDGRRPVTEVAALARQDIKDAIAVGWLPSNLTYRVKTRHGSSVSVDIEGVKDADRVDPWKAQVAEEHGAFRRTDRDEFIELERRVEQIVRRYGRFEIDSMTDYFHVDYYSNVRIPRESEQAWWAAERERLAARRRPNANRKAAG
ncbi:hypothetical protein BN13_80063 [Nostocoides jenkinsii Ben 74]|uniref:Uncharacterized protein n=2 Tax=Nostocoides jenkinsii TaxID=330834 RepID=A0A077MDG3_9MICO|nr:hypothetical protein BN13_80063 [Tetrasphaera jenkinsii Ben 74]